MKMLSGAHHIPEVARELAALVVPDHSPEAASVDLVRFLAPNSSFFDTQQLERLWAETSERPKLVSQ